ncbi:MAG: UvrB/UvrC motif-containing protein [Planctomycetota bacterium]|nr:UvrB/UvrC motif-containing protein [Planctomycetota bacterium]
MQDLTGVLREWPWDPALPKARMVQLPDGRRVLQVRVELGILQMETKGRPDGTHPGGFESLFAQARSFESEDPITPDAIEALRMECILYQQRAAAYSAVGQPALAAHDCARNLEVVEFIRTRASRPQDRVLFEQMRIPLVLMRSRSTASAAMRSNDGRGALIALDQGIHELREAFANLGIVQRFDGSPEAAILRSMRDLLVPKLPSSQRAELEERLRRAVSSENYELAAILRNELRQMTDLMPPQ